VSEGRLEEERDRGAWNCPRIRSPCLTHNSAVIVVLYEIDANEERAGDERSSILAPVF
jgi:hypothetical protein